MTEYEVQQEERDETPTVIVTEHVPVAEIKQRLGQLFNEVHAHIIASGAQPIGAPFARYHSMTDEDFEMEAGFVVDRPLDGTGRMQASTLPGGPTAVTWHTGPFEEVSEAYEAVEEWMKEHGKAPSGVPWEAYWTDPNEEPDPANWRTEVVWPVRLAA
ncbi:MAG: GyrI-like domain-containing protein [Dehalococcoidia bacterium]